jgi:hypothetical protein
MSTVRNSESTPVVSVNPEEPAPAEASHLERSAAVSSGYAPERAPSGVSGALSYQ